MRLLRTLLPLLVLALAILVGPSTASFASEEEAPVARNYVPAPPAPVSQTLAQMEAKSTGCATCHVKSDAPTMHTSPTVRLGCTDCHGGDAAVVGNPALPRTDPQYVAARERAHVLPRFPHSWNYPSSANPPRTYTLLNKEAPEYVRFVNPGDLRSAREACGACHLPVIEASERSLMATGSMLWGGAAYNNGIAPFKNYIFGEAYTREQVGHDQDHLGHPSS